MHIKGNHRAGEQRWIREILTTLQDDTILGKLAAIPDLDGAHATESVGR
jgi:hypothetical protein